MTNATLTGRSRWSDNDRNFWRFTFARDGSSWLGAMFDTGDSVEHDAACLRIHAFGLTLILWLPSILKPGREYGAFYSDRAVHLHYGPQTMDSATGKSRCWFVPWLNWRHVRHSVYGLGGEHHATDHGGDWKVWYETRQACPSRTFRFKDFDGEALTARTYIEEREWRLGTGYFKWLSWFDRPMAQRCLDIEFSGETGKRKGSWKGGTVGHAIRMQDRRELHRSAFKRYCTEHEMEFVGEVRP